MPNQLSPNFYIKTFNIQSVEGASCVNIGNNHPNGFTNYKKHNQGFGNVTGDSNTIDGIKALLNDRAFFDLFSKAEKEDIPWIKELVTEKILEFMDDEELDSNSESNLEKDFDEMENEYKENDTDSEWGDISDSIIDNKGRN